MSDVDLGAAAGERRTGEGIQRALYRIAELASAAGDLQEFYRAVHAVVGELMYASNFFIALYDEERQLICWPYYVDEVDLDVPDPNRWDAFGEGNARGTTAYVLRTGVPQLVPHDVMEELIQRGEVELVGATSPHSSWLGVPLKADERTIGVLAVQSYTKDVRYSEEDRDLLAFVGQHVGAALSRARAIEETRQRNAELALINSVQEALAGELELQAIYDVVGDKLQEVFDAQVVDIAMYDEASGLIHFPYTIERGVRFPDEPIPLLGFRKHVIETREPLLLDETTPEVAERYGNPYVLMGEPTKSSLFVPLLVGGRATGVVSLQNLDRTHAFTTGDERLLTTLARSLSVALENARLVHETRQRNAELALINSVQESIAGELELQAIYDLVGDKLQAVFDAQVVDIGIYDFEAGVTRYPYSIERGVRFPDEPSSIMASPTARMLLETKAPVLINDIEAWERERGESLPVVQGEAARAMLVVPLAVGDEVKGRITLQNLDRTNVFTENDVRLLSTLAGSLSAALENARLMHETRRRNAELGLINSLQTAIAGELDSQRIFDLTGERIEEVYDAQVVSISTYDETSGLLSFPYIVERGKRFDVDPMPVAGFRKHVLESAEPLLINENVVGAAERYGNPLVLAGEVPKSVLFVPLFTGGRPSGVISLQNLDREHAFTESDRRLLLTLAGNISAALENARLVEETQQRNAELALINSVQDSIAGELDLQAIYDAVGDRLQEVFDAQVVDICTYDRQADLVRFQYSLERGRRVAWEPYPLQSLGFMRLVIESGQPLLIDEDAAGFLGRLGLPVATDEPVLSAVTVPLIVGGAVTGLISLQNLDREHAFTESDQQLLETLAGSLSVALENARLVHETRERAAELATVNSVGQAVGSQLDLDALIELVGDRVRETFGADIAYVAMHDDAAGRIDFPYYYEAGERRVESPLQYGEGLTSQILASGQPLLLNRAVDYEGRVTLGTRSRSYLGVPIVSGERTIGVISVQSTQQEGRFDDSDARLLATIAANVGVAIQNARLYRETRRRANETAALAELGREVSATLNLSAVLNRIAERASDLLEVESSAVYLTDEDGSTLRATVALGKDADEILADTIAFGEGIIGELASRGAAEVIDDTRSDPRAVTIPGTSEEDQGALMAAPLLARGRVIGMMAVWRFGGSSFTEEDLSFLIGLSQQAAVAIENARLFEEQREAERKYRELVEQLPLTVYRDLPDVNATSEYVSPRVETMFGYPAEAWLDSDFFPSVLHPDDRERVLAEQEGWLGGNADRWTNEYRVVAADGRTVWVRDDAWVVKDAEGKPSRIHGFMIDITEQALANGEIRRQKQYFESLVDVSPVAIVVMDPTERVTGWNPAAAELFGWSEEEAVGRQIDDLVFHEGGSDEGRDVTREAVETGRAQRIGRRTRKDGAVVDVELMLVPLRVDGEHVGFYAIYHDITELQRAREVAEAATQAKSAFLATMSHEIRTPMNAVIGMTDLLLGTELSDDQREFAEVVRSSGDALLHVIDDILDYSKIEAGKLELEREPFDLRECVEGALEIVAPRASAKDIELGCLIDEAAPAGIVGDAARLRQVLLNLLSNAVKFTEHGEVVVHVDAAPARHGNYRLALAVRDTGIGIPPDRMDRLFASFSQIDASTTRRYGGTGLGLAISKRLVDLMGGTIVVESEEGVGSTFHISLTARAAEVPARISPDDALPRLAGKRVLVVDDNATNREIVSRHARAWGMEPVAVEGAADALALVDRGEPFDVAVLDMMMPGMDGIALARELRRRRSERELPLLLLTSLGRLPHARSTEVFSAQLAKPVKASQLYNALVRLVAAYPEGREAVEVPSELGPETSPLRILLAEDNPVNQKVALRLLERLGYGADVASNGREAIEALERRAYDVILMDVQMPELDGLDASRLICERWPAESRPRIVAMTANALPEDRDACFAAGMDDYVAKPIRPDELARALGRATPLRKEPNVRGEENGTGVDDAAFESLRELGGDEFVAEVVDAFLADAPTLLATLRSSLADRDADELRRAAHTLKSNGATLGAHRFSELCRELEAAAKSGDLEHAPALVERVEQAYRPFEHALTAMRATATS
jgi:PAS domain S-box-containing protein